MLSLSLFVALVAVLLSPLSANAAATNSLILQRADSTSASPPPACSSACSSLISSLSSCKLATSITSASTAATSLATCACPYFTADTTCDACLVANASGESATTLFSTLVANCKVSNAKAASTIETLLASSTTSGTTSSATPSGAVLRDGSTSAATPAKDSQFVVLLTVALAVFAALLA